MILVTVNHYLNKEGLTFFSTWFEGLLTKISIMDGFIDTGYHLKKRDSFARVIVIFEDNDKLNQWASSEQHFELMKHLDPYRTKPWDSFKKVYTEETP